MSVVRNQLFEVLARQCWTDLPARRCFIPAALVHWQLTARIQLVHPHESTIGTQPEGNIRLLEPDRFANWSARPNIPELNVKTNIEALASFPLDKHGLAVRSEMYAKGNSPNCRIAQLALHLPIAWV